MKKLSTQLKASFTIEGSFIYPIILILFISITISSFYLHDKIVANSIAYRQTLYFALDTINDSTLDNSEETILNNISSYCISKRHLNIKYSPKTNEITLIGLRHNTTHYTLNFEHCDKIRKYSVIISTIKN